MADRIPVQGDLFAPILQAYMAGDKLSNHQLYNALVAGGHVSQTELETKTPVGRDGALVSVAKRRVRWWQHNRELSTMDAQPLNVNHGHAITSQQGSYPALS